MWLGNLATTGFILGSFWKKDRSKGHGRASEATLWRLGLGDTKGSTEEEPWLHTYVRQTLLSSTYAFSTEPASTSYSFSAQPLHTPS